MSLIRYGDLGDQLERRMRGLGGPIGAPHVPAVGQMHIGSDGLAAWYGAPMSDRMIRARFNPPGQICQHIRQRAPGSKVEFRSERDMEVGRTVIKARLGSVVIPNLFTNKQILEASEKQIIDWADYIAHRLINPDDGDSDDE